MSRRIRMEFSLLPGLARSLSAPLRRVLDGMNDGLPRQMQGPEDPDLREIWERELIEDFRRDAERLLQVLGDPGFGAPGYELEEAEVEEMVRGCSALRLSLRQAALGDLTDEALEAGAVDPEGLSPDQRESFACFWFLGALQELLISLLDPESASGGGLGGSESV